MIFGFGVGLITAQVLMATAYADMDRSVMSSKGRALTVQHFVADSQGAPVPVNEPSADIDMILVCGPDKVELKEAVLWMPQHGHGSAPTRIEDSEESIGICYWILGVDFVMAGDWEVRLNYADGDTAVFGLKVP
jgi:hypothetical protein